MTALLTTETLDPAELVRRVKAPPLVGRDLVREVTRGERFEWTEKGDPMFAPDLGVKPADVPPPHVVAIDYGAKENIFRCLVDAGFRVSVLPSDTTSDEVMKLKPDGVFLSNGPGDPSVLHHEVATIRDILGKTPVFGICLGHQLIGQAIGAKTFKLKFGHHGGNQPVKNLKTGAIEITSQNHGFAVDPESIPNGVAKVTHVNLNDMTCEGMELPASKAFSVQYHPESAPGPHDSLYLFRQFRELVDTHRGDA
jgi:carbamoyl-phosphate synthase small subunit